MYWEAGMILTTTWLTATDGIFAGIFMVYLSLSLVTVGPSSKTELLLIATPGEEAFVYTRRAGEDKCYIFSV